MDLQQFGSLASWICSSRAVWLFGFSNMVFRESKSIEFFAKIKHTQICRLGLGAYSLIRQENWAGITRLILASSNMLNLSERALLVIIRHAGVSLQNEPCQGLSCNDICLIAALCSYSAQSCFSIARLHLKI